MVCNIFSTSTSTSLICNDRMEVFCSDSRYIQPDELRPFGIYQPSIGRGDFHDASEFRAIVVNFTLYLWLPSYKFGEGALDSSFSFLGE